jgi:hypothetical protein
MVIRNFQSGDEIAQVQVYNSAASALPGFKPAQPGEVERRYQSADPDPGARFYAVEDGNVLGYAVLNPNGRVSYPWCLPEAQALRPALLDAVLSALIDRGCRQAWATYRTDWEPVLSFFADNGFAQSRVMINSAAALARLPRAPVPSGYILRTLKQSDLPQLVAVGQGIFTGLDLQTLERFYWANPFFGASSLFAVVPQSDETKILGVALLISNAAYADPTKLDAAMPCFRLGAFGTESERHKRVNGLFSCLFADELAGEILLTEAVRRLDRAGSTHLAAQVPSDQPTLVAFYDRFLDRQGSFPILARSLSGGNRVTRRAAVP